MTARDPRAFARHLSGSQLQFEIDRVAQRLSDDAALFEALLAERDARCDPMAYVLTPDALAYLADIRAEGAA